MLGIKKPIVSALVVALSFAAVTPAQDVPEALARGEAALLQIELDDGFAQGHVLHDLDHRGKVIHLTRFVRIHTDVCGR